LDLALIVAEAGADVAASGVFTLNRFCAAPVELCKEHLKAGTARAILVNSGIANACTGEEGLRTARGMATAAARGLDLPMESVLVASTGVIGQQIPMEPVQKAMDALVEGLRPAGWADVARAIMTTDTVPKMSVARVEIGGKTATIGGVAKGSGMIAPNMATMLAFACTDAAIQEDVLDYWVRVGTEESFNRVTVDGDTSTNDTLLVLAGGRAGNAVIRDRESAESRVFGEALKAVLLDLAKQVVLDGEGATKFIEIVVTGAESVADARTIAFTIAHSPLVKTAFFGEDANWGRIVAAAGRAGVPIMPENAALFFDDVCVFREGTPVQDSEIEEKATRVFKKKEIRVRLDLGMGKAIFTAYTCDLSYDYVKINASYRS
jgi:glutamate N-acetyltransferase/amino-acid N-acetyltransferase